MNLQYQTLQRLTDWDRRLCLRLNRGSRRQPVRQLFCAVSRLGDGVFWYGLMAALLLAGRAAALPAVLHMICTGLTCTVLYKALKRRTSRLRPYQAHREILRAGEPLDQYSFPSGHTLHAVAFSIVAIAYYPLLVWVLLPFTLLVAASRVVLGLHYPSDVFAAAVIGTLVARLALTLV